MLAQAHIAAANMAIALRWTGCATRLNLTSRILGTWLLAGVLAFPVLMDSVMYQSPSQSPDEYGGCVETKFQRIFELCIGWGIYGFNIVAYTIVIVTVCKHSPTSVSGAYVRYSAGYLTGYFVNYSPLLIYFIQAEVLVEERSPRHRMPSVVWRHIAYIFLNSNGLINILVYLMHWNLRCCLCAPLASARRGDGFVSEPRLSTFSVAYLDNAEVRSYEPSVLTSQTVSSYHSPVEGDEDVEVSFDPQPAKQADENGWTAEDVAVQH